MPLSCDAFAGAPAVVSIAHAAPAPNWESATYGGLPEWTCVKNTFIDCPADRSASLDEFVRMNEKKCKSCPVSGMVMHPASKPPQSFTIPEERSAEECSNSSSTRSIPMANMVSDQGVVLNISTMLPPRPPVISVGSQAHQFGNCKPCGFVHKPEGCSNGANCGYCHLCPPGTIKQRKQIKQFMRKVQNFAQRQMRRSNRWY